MSAHPDLVTRGRAYMDIRCVWTQLSSYISVARWPIVASGVFMKRQLSDPCALDQAKISRISTRRTAVTTEEMAEDDEDHMEEVEYNVETVNRFAPLPIPLPEKTTLRMPVTPKIKNPPAFFIFESPKTIKAKLPNAVLKNQNNCTVILPNSIDDHTKLHRQILSWNWKFHTQNPTTHSYKRFVLHGLNTHPFKDIEEDLNKYGLPLY